MIDSIFDLSIKGVPVVVEPFTIEDVIEISKELFVKKD